MNPKSMNIQSAWAVAAPVMAICLLVLPVQANELIIESDLKVEGSVEVGTAQTAGTLKIQGESGSSAAPSLQAGGDGGVVLGGTLGQGKIPLEGSGTRLMWYPKKAALRVGHVSVENSWMWDDGYIGEHSMGLGMDAYAIGYSSVALGRGRAIGGSSTALAQGIAEGDWSVAIGQGATASGEQAIALGKSTTAEGDNAFAAGLETQAESYLSFAIGRYNVGGGDGETWEAADPLFEVGNGTELEPANAFTVYKNGNARFSGAVHIEPQGDISMGGFTD